MIIILEGADGAGKTTLAKRLAKDLGFHYHKPLKPTCRRDVAEFIRMATAPTGNLVMDRSTQISDVIYSKVLKQPQYTCGESLVDAVYVACVPSKLKVSKHFKPHKSIDEVNNAVRHRAEIVRAYDNFFNHSFGDELIRYNWHKDSYYKLLALLRSKVDPVLTLLSKTIGMYHKFSMDSEQLSYGGIAEKQFRTVCMQEELLEYMTAQTRESELDALVDLVVFALGTVERHGMSAVFEQAFDRVIESNLTKSVGSKKSRGSYTHDLVKNENWQSCRLTDLIGDIDRDD